MNAEFGEIAAVVLTTSDVGEPFQVSALLSPVAGPLASSTGNGAYDQDDGVDRVVADQPPEVVIPRIVLLASTGMAARAIAREVRCTPGTVSKWRVR